MSIFVNKDSKVIVQGITGGEGTKHTARMLAAGTNIVGGVNARKAGTTVTHKAKDGSDVELKVFGTVAEAIAETGADVSIVFVPPAFTKAAVLEAIEAKIGLVVVITEGVPVQDTAEFWAAAKASVDENGKQITRIIGPNCPGIITPEECLVGITPANITGKGKIGLVSKSGTLTYQMMFELADIGFTTAIGIGGDPIIGTTHIDALEAFEADPETEGIVMIGEIGGDAEERAAEYIKANVTKPVVGYVAGFTAPEGKTMGHAGAIVSGSSGTAQAKKEALEAAGVKVGKTPSEAANLMREIFANKEHSARVGQLIRPPAVRAITLAPPGVSYIIKVLTRSCQRPSTIGRASMAGVFRLGLRGSIKQRTSLSIMITLYAMLYSQHIGSQAERLLGCASSACHAHRRGISCIAKGQSRWRRESMERNRPTPVWCRRLGPAGR